MFTIFYPFALLQAVAAPESIPAAPAPATCSSEVHAGFDLWVGEWDVYPTGANLKVATSRIERLSNGCAIRETWMPIEGAGGTSISFVNHDTGRWEQIWIGSDGKRVDFEGGVVAAKMVLTGYWDDVGGPGQDALVRMSYSQDERGSVRQFGEVSTNHGVSWQPFFDYTYNPRKSVTP